MILQQRMVSKRYNSKIVIQYQTETLCCIFAYYITFLYFIFQTVQAHIVAGMVVHVLNQVTKDFLVYVEETATVLNVNFANLVIIINCVRCYKLVTTKLIRM